MKPTNYSKSDQDGPRVVSVIQSWRKVGFGNVPEDPVRMVMCLHTLDGILLAEVDPYRPFLDVQP